MRRVRSGLRERSATFDDDGEGDGDASHIQPTSVGWSVGRSVCPPNPPLTVYQPFPNFQTLMDFDSLFLFSFLFFGWLFESFLFEFGCILSVGWYGVRVILSYPNSNRIPVVYQVNSTGTVQYSTGIGTVRAVGSVRSSNRCNQKNEIRWKE